jgi:hypothetical protein
MHFGPIRSMETDTGGAMTASRAQIASRLAPFEVLGEEAGAMLCLRHGQGGDTAWLLLALEADRLAADAGERAANLVALRASAGPHVAGPRTWCPARRGEPAALALPAPGVECVTALPTSAGGGTPELLARLLLAESLTGLARAHEHGLWHGMLTAGSLWLTGATPDRLIADCPRDPRVAIVGCGVFALLAPAAQAASVAAARARGVAVAPEAASSRTSGPAADVWAIGDVVRALVTAPSAELSSLLEALQAWRADQRPTAAQAATRARELALEGLATWRSSEPPMRRRAPEVEPIARPGTGKPSSRPRTVTRRGGAGGSSARWTLPRIPPTSMPGALQPLGLFGARGGGANGLLLSLAPTAMAGILSVLLALALLLGYR